MRWVIKLTVIIKEEYESQRKTIYIYFESLKVLIL